MARYIDAEELTDEIKSLRVTIFGMDIFSDNAKDSVLRVIDEQPTADVVEVKHGYWIEEGGKVPECSICKKICVNKGDYCIHCGADMRGDKNDL